MYTPTRKLEVRGIRVTTRTPRRFAAIAVRPETVTLTPEDEAVRIFGRRPGTYPAFAEVIKRSDSYATARKAATKYGRFIGGVAVVVDLTTGEEIKP